MKVRGWSNIHQIQAKGLLGDRSNVSQRWVKYQSEMGQILVRGGSNIHQRYRSRVLLEIDQMLVRDGSNISQR